LFQRKKSKPLPKSLDWTGLITGNYNNHTSPSHNSHTHYRGVMEIWKMLLDKTGEMAKYKLTCSDLLLNKVSDVMKQQRRVKETAFKRVSVSIAIYRHSSLKALFDIIFHS